MRPSRGMGAIAPSKMPKARTIKKKDGNEPVEVFEEGGKVNVAQPKSVARKTAGYR